MDADHGLVAVYQAPPPPSSPSTRTLTVTAVNADSGVLVSVAPPATNGLAAGTSPFQRVYALNTTVTLTAPSAAGGNNFSMWQRDGSDVTAGLTVTVTMDADHTLTAFYAGGGPVGWWKLDETSGTTAFDASGWSNHGRLTNGPVFTSAARVAGGLIFDGINDHVVVADAEALDFNNRSFTVALWVKTTKSGPQALIEKQHMFFDGVFIFALNRDGAVPGGFSVWHGGDWIDSIFRGVTDGQFHHLAVTCDRASFRLYRDGQLDKIQASSANYANTTLPMNFGRFATGNVGWFYQGVMDDVRRYNRALTDAEISTLANPGPFPAPAPLLTETSLRHLRLSVLASGGVVLRGSGAPDQVYEIEASRNLRDWSAIGSIEVGSDGVFEFTNATAREFQTQFYRVVPR
jgi:hypothetical protein